MYLKNEDYQPSPLFSSREVKSVSKKIQVSPRTKDFPPLILVVEDNEDTRLMLKYLLEIWNYQVIEANTGEEALQVAAREKPDVILMDYRLPRIDGITATSRIREQPSLKDTVIIFVSASSEPSVRASAVAAGGDDFLIKPINFGALEISLEKHLKRRNKWRESFISKTL